MSTIPILSNFITFLLTNSQPTLSYNPVLARICIRTSKKKEECQKKQLKNMSGKSAQLFSTCITMILSIEISNLKIFFFIKYNSSYQEQHQNMRLWMGNSFTSPKSNSMWHSCLYSSINCQQTTIWQQDRYLEHWSSHIWTSIWHNSLWNQTNWRFGQNSNFSLTQTQQ